MSYTDANGNAMLPKKKCFKDTRQKISVPPAMSTNIHKKSSKLQKKTKILVSGHMLGQDRPEKTQANVWF